MRVTTQMFWMPKAGNSDAEYEDAFWPAETAVDLPLQGLCCAVADGATETSFSGAWANLLTHCWCDENGDLDQFLVAFPALQEQWASQIESVAMPWYVEEKARAGAFSSIIGLKLSDVVPDSGWPARWEAFAVGDSCLFHVRAGEIYAFPLSHPMDFNNSPYLLSTAIQSVEEVGEHFSHVGGKCFAGDVFYLMTDALACWFLRRHGEGQNIAESLLDLDSTEMFQRIIEGQRVAKDAEGRFYLRNDDVTLYRLEIHE